MTIMKRLVRLMKADIHAVLDWVEDPEAVVAQAIRDMEEEIQSEQARLVALRSKRNEWGAREGVKGKELERVREELGFCLQVKNEELGKHTVRRRLELEQELREVKRIGMALATEEEETGRRIAEYAAKLKEIEEQAERQKNVEGPAAPSSSAGGITSEEVELAFMKAKQEWEVAHG
jgi:phage shock protein A